MRHSLSPLIHNAAFAAVGLDWVYVAFEVADGDAPAALDAARALGLAGLSVTMPHKAAVAAAVDELTPTAARLGAVNCVIAAGDGRLVGDNTDGGGFVDALVAETGRTPEGARCVVVGAGGAARAIVLALADAGAARVGVLNRTPEGAARAAALADDVGAVVTEDAIGDADIVVNATPVGMSGRADQHLVAFDPARIKEDQLVVDIVYEPLETELMRRAAARGARVVGGVPMLVHQAARAFTSWTGQPAPLQVMTDQVLNFSRGPADGVRERARYMV